MKRFIFFLLILFCFVSVSEDIGPSGGICGVVKVEAAKKSGKKSKATSKPKVTKAPEVSSGVPGENQPAGTENTAGDDSGSKEVTDEDVEKCASTVGKYDGTASKWIKDNKKSIIEVYKTADAKKWSQATVSGMIANALVESHMNTAAGSSTGIDIGAFQVRNIDGDKDKYNRMAEAAKECKKAGHKICANGLCSKWQCQLMAAMGGSKMAGFMYNNDVVELYESRRTALGDKYKWNGHKSSEIIPIAEMPDLKKGWEFEKLENGATAALVLVCCWERAAGGLYFVCDSSGKNAQYTKPDSNPSGVGKQGDLATKEATFRPRIAQALDVCFGGGKASATKSDPEKAKETAESAAVTGFLNESEFISYTKMADITIEFPDLSQLSDEENENLELWKGDLSKTNEENILIKGGRIIVMFGGILFTIWMLLIYLAYWLDRVNNFIDIDFLPMITFKKLRISPTEDECTFSVKDLAKGETRTINHKHIIAVCVCGIVFGCLIITGAIFSIVNELVNRVLSFLGI